MSNNLANNIIFLLDGILDDEAGETDLESVNAALIFSHFAWNNAIQEGSMKPEYYRTELTKLEQANPHFWQHLIGDDSEELLDTLKKRKIVFFSDDKRLIKSCFVNTNGTITVEENNNDNRMHMAEL